MAHFADEIVAVKIPGKGGEIEVATDEQPRRADPRKNSDAEARLRKGRHGHGGEFVVDFRRRGGTSVGAHRIAAKQGLKPLARIVAQASFAGEPRWFPTAPVGAIKKILDGQAGHRTTSICTKSAKPSPMWR